MKRIGHKLPKYLLSGEFQKYFKGIWEARMGGRLYLEIIFSNFGKIVAEISKSFKEILGWFPKMFKKMYE